MEEIIDMVAETLGSCFFILVFWQFVSSGSAYSLAALVEKMALALGG
jgi:hypothetical protein